MIFLPLNIKPVFLAGVTVERNVELANTGKELKETVFSSTRTPLMKTERCSEKMKTVKSMRKVSSESIR